MTKNTAAALAVEQATEHGSCTRKVVECTGNTFVIRVRLTDGRVADAWSTGRMMRNMNLLLRGGLDAQGRPQLVQQAHCLCNDGHALAAIRALEDLAGVVLPHCAIQVRSIVQSLRCIQEHLLHVYQFHLSDWICPASALRADPAGLAGQSDRDREYFLNTKERLRTFFDVREGMDSLSSQGAPDYHGPDEFHLLVASHSFESLKTGCVITQALSLLGCGPDGFSAYRPGGLPENMDLGPEVLGQLRGLLCQCKDFIQTVFLEDLQRLARVYGHWSDIGRGSAFLAWEDFAHPRQEHAFLPGGFISTESEGTGVPGAWAVRTYHVDDISELSDPDWNETDRNHYRLQPGESDPAFHWNKLANAFWLPAPRLCGEACEAGPLARVLGGLAHGTDAVGRITSDILEGCGLSLAALNSTIGRVVSRGTESMVLSDACLQWLDELEASLPHESGALCSELNLPASGVGHGCVEVPRGALVHTIRLENNRVESHDYLIPSLWNFSPRDEGGVRGPLERALVGTAVADPEHPLEIFRTVHELDPCNACLVVVEDTDTGRTSVVNAK